VETVLVAATSSSNSFLMNFSDHRSRLEAGINYSSQRKEAISQLIAILKERIAIEKDTSKRIGKLADADFPAFNTPGLVNLLSGLRSTWKVYAEQSRLYAESMEKDVIQSLCYFQSIQNDEVKQAIGRVKALITLAKGKVMNIDKRKTRYMKSCRDTESFAITSTASRQHSEENRKKVYVKIATGRAEMVSSEDEYRNAVEDFSSFSVDYSAQIVGSM
jgi:hypothetical protein